MDTFLVVHYQILHILNLSVAKWLELLLRIACLSVLWFWISQELWIITFEEAIQLTY